MFGDEELVKLHKQRGLQIAGIVLGAFLIILIRLWYLQVIQGELFHKFSMQNRLREEIVRAPRGMIFGKNSTLMVDNVPRLDAVLTRQFLSSKEETLKRLSQILGMRISEIEARIKKYSSQAKYRGIIIKKNLSFEEVAKIETQNSFLPGITVEMFIGREYEYGEVGAHLLGYISEINRQQLHRYRKRDGIDYVLGDFIGQFGLEEEFDHYLRGMNGYEYVEVDAKGRKKKYINTDNLFKGIEDQAATPGKNVTLTVDVDLQNAAYEALKEHSGSVVAIDVETGKILAMVSTPSFLPSEFSTGLSAEYWKSLRENPENPLRDRTIQEHFSPGSTFKPFTAITGLETGVINEESKIRCHGTFKLGRRVYHSWKRYGREKVDVRDALKKSCNIFFYKVASELDIDDLAHYAKLFGFGSKSGIHLPREVAGLIPTKEWKLKRNGIPWQGGETLSCAIGQSYVLVTTLQLANAYAAIATKGKLYRPYVVDSIWDNKGNVIRKYEPELIREIHLKESTWNLVHEGLYKVANEPKGTAFWRRGLGNNMAGKTGTSQVIRASSSEELYSKCEEMEYKYRHHGLFVAFAPYENPKIAVASLVEHGCHGSSAAAPVVERVIDKYLSKYYPEVKKKHKKIQQQQMQQLRKKWKEAKEAKEAKKRQEAKEAKKRQEAKEQAGESDE